MPRFMMLALGLGMMLRETAKDGTEGGGGKADDKKADDQKPGADDQKDKGQKSGTDDSKSDKDKFDISSLPQEAQDLIKNLRGEAAKNRTEKNKLSTRLEKFEKVFKALDPESEENEEPEVKLGKVTSYAETLQAKNAMLELAYENGVPADQRDYFEFLMSKALDSLKEGEELSEEALNEVLSKVKSKGPANTSTKTDGGKGKEDKKPGQADGVTLDQFLAMGISAKSKLFSEKREVYDALMAEAKAKKLL